MLDVVVDTDVFSFVFKGDTRASLYAKHLDCRRINLSFTTVAELYRWSLTHGWWKPRVQSLQVSLGRCSVLSYDDETAWDWGRIMSIKGQPMSPAMRGSPQRRFDTAFRWSPTTASTSSTSLV